MSEPSHDRLDEVCGDCQRPARDHYPRADWRCPEGATCFNTASDLTKRIALAAGYNGLHKGSTPNEQWSSDIDGLVKHIRNMKRQLDEWETTRSFFR